MIYRSVNSVQFKDIKSSTSYNQECFKSIYPRLEFNNKWTPDMGFTPSMILEICQTFDLTCYEFDVSRKWVFKNISKNKNYAEFVFYAVNNHFYQVTDHDALDM